MLAEGYADHGCVLVLTNDRSYWQPTALADTIDAQFRLHEGRLLEGTLRWADHAGTGTTARRDTPLALTGRHACHWREYSQVSLDHGRTATFRYLLVSISTGPAGSIAPQGAGPAVQPTRQTAGLHAASGPTAGNPEAARKLAERSPDGSFALAEIVAELHRSGSRYAESTIRTHVTSRMCADSPDHHGTGSPCAAGGRDLAERRPLFVRAAAGLGGPARRPRLADGVSLVQAATAVVRGDTRLEPHS